MAEYTPVQVVPLWRNKSLSAGDAATSDIIDLRDRAQKGAFCLASRVSAGTAGTAGTTTYTFVGCSTETGTFVAPSTGNTIGSNGTGKTDGFIQFLPEMMPFMKIVATQEGSGNAGKDSKISAELIIQ